MTIYTQIRQFVDLKETAKAETKSIFQPILDGVGRQKKRFMLSPPVNDALGVEWIVRRPISAFPPSYQGLSLLILATKESEEVNLVLFSRYMGYLESTMDDHRDYELDNHTLYELARFPLNGKINPAAVVRKIMAEARRIFLGQ